MNFICANCQEILLPKNININTNLGKCENCNTIHKLDGLKNSPIKGTEEQVEKILIPNPPADSKVIMEKISEDMTVITLPKNGIKGAHYPILIFAFIWLGAIGFATLTAKNLSGMFLPLIPFWGVGVLIIIGVIKGTQESQKVTILKDTLKIERHKLYKLKTFETRLNEIHEVVLAKEPTNPLSFFENLLVSKQSRNPQQSSNEYGVPTIISFAKNKAFFEITSKENQDWIVAYLSNTVKKMNG